MPRKPGSPLPTGKALVTRQRWLDGLDRVVESRYGAAEQLVADTRRRLGAAADVDQVVDAIVKKYTRELAAVAAVSGGTAAVPGVGTSVSLAMASADLAYTMGRLAEMVLAIGVAHGHDAQSFEARKTWVLAVLGMGRGAVVGVDGLAGRVGSEGGARLVTSITSTQLDKVNSKLATKLLTKLTTEQAALRMGRVLPFGIGAGVGAAGNAMIVRSIGRAAREFFGPTAGAPDGTAPPPGVINTTGRETPPPVA